MLKFINAEHLNSGENANTDLLKLVLEGLPLQTEVEQRKAVEVLREKVQQTDVENAQAMTEQLITSFYCYPHDQDYFANITAEEIVVFIGYLKIEDQFTILKYLKEGGQIMFERFYYNFLNASGKWIFKDAILFSQPDIEMVDGSLRRKIT